MRSRRVMLARPPILLLALGASSAWAGCGARGAAQFRSVPPQAPAAAGVPAGASVPSDESSAFALATPESVGIDARKLSELTTWVETSQLPIFSLLVSRRGQLVYELYTSHITRDLAHYVMSVTKSVTSALVGIAIDQRLIASDAVTVADALPPNLFPSEQDRARFAALTLHQVLGMSALDAPVPPHEKTDDARARQTAFLASDNRARFALGQRILPDPGASFLYTDVTPSLAGAAVTYAAHQTLFEFASAHLFGPLGFRNAEWMHEDAAGIDNAAYGLRMRPIDMQKLGVLYLRGGDWNGRRVLSDAWVKQSFDPWIRSKPHLREPNYGNYFWTEHYGPWTARVANGWKGQRIAIIPAKNVVVTMTADLEENEEAAVKSVMELVLRATTDEPLPENPEANARLQSQLAAANGLERIPRGAEPRMVPSASPKERHHGLAPLR